MTYTKETISFPIERYIDADGKPTCIGDIRSNDACPFLMVSHFGTREHCFWEVSDPEKVHAPVLKRRNDGAGRLIPHCACPVWHSVPDHSTHELTDDQIRGISHDFDFDGTQTDHCFRGKPLDEYWDYQGQQILAFARALLKAQRRLNDGNT